MISKLEFVLQEVDEVEYWLELLVESKTITEHRLAELRKEADELTAVFVTVVKRIKAKRNRRR